MFLERDAAAVDGLQGREQEKAESARAPAVSTESKFQRPFCDIRNRPN